MYEALIKQHARDITDITSEHNGSHILVYKGFPVDFLLALSNIFPFFFDKGHIADSGKIDLRRIVADIRDLIGNLLKNKLTNSIATYEEFILLSQKIDLALYNGRIIVFENNLFEEFPNQSTENFLDIEKAIDSDNLEFRENDLFNVFYANSSIGNGVNWIQYKEAYLGDIKNAETKPFFGDRILNSTLDYEEIAPTALPDRGALIFPSSKGYQNLKYKIFAAERIEKPCVLFTDLVTLSNQTYLAELKILKYVFEQNGLPLSICTKKRVLQKDHREEFLAILRQYWDSESFRDLTFYENPASGISKTRTTQGSVIEDVVGQVEKCMANIDFNDIFLTAPTGSGKSILFQIPAIYIGKEYDLVTIVVSPLKALMYDQVGSLESKGIDFAAYINSDISLFERQRIVERIRNGEISILYLSPELLLSYDLRHFIGDRKLGLFVIDEVHLVTTWGRDFRIDYWYLGNYIRNLRKYRDHLFPVFAVTATAVYGGRNDIVFETIGSLNMQTPALYLGNVRRNDVTFEIRDFQYKGSHESAKMEKTKQVIMDNIYHDTKSIVYFPWTKQIRLIKGDLPSEYQERIGIYYGAVDKTEKQIVMDKFSAGRILTVLATKAFGMGVDINDIEIIYHHAPSGNLSDYVQEIGRVARDKDTSGKAAVDFCKKDLKFTRILYGLSSIKQYQVKLVLQKVWNLYARKQKQNFLTSVVDFAFVFGDRISDLESKVKSALLLLEKDLEKKYGYRVLIVRPKSLFSTVFACVPSSIEDEFLQKYGRFSKQCSTIDGNVREGFQKNKIVTCDTGNIFRIELNKVWETFFARETFPMVKKKFFDKTLFAEFNEAIFPRYRLSLNLRFSPKETQERLDKYFSILDLTLKDLSPGYFSRREFERAARKRFDDDILVRRVTNLVANLYTAPSEYTQNRGLSRLDIFLQTKRTDSGEEVFRVVTSAYVKVRYYAVRKLNAMFVGDKQIFTKYLAADSKESEFCIKMAYLLESLLLGTYELIGGRLPQVFIRINDPYKIRLLSESREYTNDVLTDINSRHKDAIETMSHFFTSKMDDNQRWDFIENYFLGND